MGLKEGEKIERIHLIEIVNTRKERLFDITEDDVVKEGFPEWTRIQFIDFVCAHYKTSCRIFVNRIEFKYLGE